MKKKILIGLGAIIFSTALIFNVSTVKDNNSLVLSKMGTIAVAQTEDIGEGGNGGSGYGNYKTVIQRTYTSSYTFYQDTDRGHCTTTTYTTDSQCSGSGDYICRPGRYCEWSTFCERGTYNYSGQGPC